MAAMTEMRGNWEPDRGMLGWTRAPEERTCRYCRRGLMHSQAEHDLVYPVDRATLIRWEREQADRQVEADNKILQGFIAQGMTEEEAADELYRWMGQGRGLVEPTPRPQP